MISCDTNSIKSEDLSELKECIQDKSEESSVSSQRKVLSFIGELKWGGGGPQ